MTRDAHTRICPECGLAFAPQTHQARASSIFCTPYHQEAFHRRNGQRGRILAPLRQIARLGKNGRTALTAWANSEACALEDKWNAEDRAAGRRPDLVVAAKMRSGWQATDLK